MELSSITRRLSQRIPS